MAYLGNDLQVAFPVYRNIDDISGSFNSVLKTFPLTVSGVAPVPAPLYSQQCLISVGGVVQRPDDSGTEGFRLSGGNIIFASAPTTGADFFGIILAGADYVNAGGNFPSGTAAVPSITFNDDLDTGIYNSGINQVSITTSGTERLRIDSAGQIESVSLGTAAAPAFSFTTDPNTGIYSPGADQVAISTGGAGRLLIDSFGGVRFPDGNLYGKADNTGSLAIYGGGGFNQGAGVLVTGSSNPAAANTIIFVNGAYSEKMRLDASGRLGIGTSAPGSTLHCNSTSAADVYLRTSNSAATSGFDVGVSSGAIAYVFNRNNTDLRFGTNGAERVTISAGGNVGIGTTGPNVPLDVYRASGVVTVRVQSGASVGDLAHDGTNLYLANGANGPIQFWTNGSERARIDSSGRLLVGTSNALTTVADSPKLQVFVGDQGAASFVRGSNNEFGPNIHLVKSRNATPGSYTALQSGDELGSLFFIGDDGSDLNQAAARISANVDGTPGANDMPGRLVFSTTADGSSSPTERMRIAQNGVITIQNGAVAVIGTLTDGATITPDFAADCNFTVTLGGSRNMANPTNITAGQSGSIFIVQDATGSRTLSWGSYWDFPGGTAPTLSTAAGAVDRIDYIVRSSTSIHTVFTANYS